MNLRETLRINERGHLEIGGCDTVELAAKFGTPLYCLDEKHIRDMCRAYRDALTAGYGEAQALYASKALSCKALYKIVHSEGLGADVVSSGELYTALSGGMPADKIYFHGNNKTGQEIVYALNSGVGTIVIDGDDEIDFLSSICEREGKRASVLLRVNPGVEAHTHHYIQTSKVDSKFGLSIKSGDAERGVKNILSRKQLDLKGFHCHIGSQIFELKPFKVAVAIILDFAAEMRRKYGLITRELNLGGGLGIWYAKGDRKTNVKDYKDFVKVICDAVRENCERISLDRPRLLLEPGRSIVGEAGITLYTVGNIKDIKGIRKYVGIDGGMFDNPRYALYQAKYTAILANRASEQPAEKVSIAGKCCESGDLIAVDVMLPPAKRGDILAVFSTGAYNYSMASNYNRNAVPPVVLCKGGQAEYIVKPQSYEDIARNDTFASWL